MKDTLKVGLVLDDSLDVADGVQQYIMTVGTWLTGAGHEVHYVVGETKRQDIKNLHSLGRNVRLRFNANRMSVPLPVSRKAISKLLQREQFDVLHIQMPYSPWLAGRLIAAADTQTAVVATFHVAPASGLVTAANHALRLWSRQSLHRLDAVVSVSSVAQAFAKRTFHLDSMIIPNPVKLKRFHTEKTVSLNQELVRLVFLGRLVERKGCQYLLQAVAELSTRNNVRPFQLVIGGHGPLDTSLQAYVRDHNLQKLVSFAGFIDERDKPRFLASADIAVFPSTGGESFGIVLLEAMASGAAVLAAGNPGYHTVLGGFPEALVEPAQPQLLAEQLLQYINNSAARDKLRSKQHKLVQQYDIGVIGPQLVAAYKAALRQRRSQEIM